MAGLGPSTYPSTIGGWLQPGRAGREERQGQDQQRPKGSRGQDPRKRGHSPQGRRRGRRDRPERQQAQTGDSAAPPAGRDDRAQRGGRPQTPAATRDAARRQSRPDRQGGSGQRNRGARATGARSGAAKAQARHQKRPQAAHRRGTAAYLLDAATGRGAGLLALSFS